MLMELKEIPQVAVDSMNKTHEREIGIVNALFELITQKRDGQPVDDELGKAVDLFADHVEQHFSGEEQLMQQTGFPAFGVHKGEHDRVRAELAPVFEAWRQESNIGPLATYLENIHPGWAKNHIATMDAMTAYFIAQTMTSSNAR